MISVSEALGALFNLVTPTEAENVPLTRALGRTLIRPAQATHSQPPFPASAMDGYAVVSARIGDRFDVIGESAAGHGFEGTVATGQAVRIFTGAPVPPGATQIVIQEDVRRTGDQIEVTEDQSGPTHIRPAGNDFAIGAELSAPRVLTPNDIALLAAMNVAQVPVGRRPTVALIATGDELVAPGTPLGPDQIVASNTYGLCALFQQLGALPQLLPIARDTPASLRATLELAQAADLIVTVGGASVGDHDIVAGVAAEMGLQQAFHKVAMRPGKPLMSGRLGRSMLIGLPGNPVSAMVCGHVFVAPVIRAMQGQPAQPAPRQQAALACDLGANGPREHYMRAHLGAQGLQVFERQDSSLLSVLGRANALVVRPPQDAARRSGDRVDYIAL